MATAPISVRSENAIEERRKSLLAESDFLLDDVEMLRLNDKSEAPPRLREAIHALQVRLGRRNPSLPPATLEAAHDLVFGGRLPHYRDLSSELDVLGMSAGGLRGHSES